MKTTETVSAAPSTIDSGERIRAIQQRVWIGYSRALRIRDQLDRLLEHPRVHRMPNLAIIGETNNGKTTLLQNFVRKHLPPDDPNNDHTTMPILLIDTPPEPDEARLYRKILERLFATVGRREPADSMLSRVQVILRHLETRMIILDEFNNAVAGTPIKQRRFLNAIRLMGNALQLPIVVAGTPEALAALQSDPQLANRFEPVFLPKWTLDAEYARLLMSAEKVLGLNHTSGLIQPAFAQRLLDLSEGSLGETMELIRRLAINAIHTGKERITLDMLKPDALAALGWTAPSRRTTYSV